MGELTFYPKIDYYAFTLPTHGIFEGVSEDVQQFVIRTFVSVVEPIALLSLNEGSWELEDAKGFYHGRLRHNPSGVALSFGSVNAHVYCELSGRACDNFDAIDCLMPLIDRTHERCSRIDVAADFPTDTTPEQFSASRNCTRWKYAPSYPSQSGTTVYVGSRKGERMARVYRFSPPHPRADFLRVETEYKGAAARALAGTASASTMADLLSAAHSVFGWTDPIWTSRVGEGEKLPYRKHSPSNANTVRWIYGDVSTAIRRAVKDDLIDFEEWLNFLREGHF